MRTAWLRQSGSLGSDPRDYQIAALSLLLLYGLFQLDFQVSIAQIGVTLASTLIFQFLCSRAVHLARVEFKSAMISGLSLCLLLRTNHLWLVPAAAALAIGTKFFIRLKGGHLFNPTNIAIVALLIVASDKAWVSPGQWGNFAFFAFLMLCLGSLVVTRAARADVTVAFLIFHCGILFARSAWLNEPLAIPFHRIQNGALLLFAFFMISDPKTTPESRPGRIIFAFLVALGGAYVQFKLFRQNGLLWSLAFCSLATPLLNFLFPGARYSWAAPRAHSSQSNTIPQNPIYEPARA
ncbi:MAG TPA: RnfABCDGE type electron transport complex subunit D [Methylomirabilota bacterium]|nr:RnfABCDGE type electron transport complex subunit D [Methylomirabilota bacterium]